MKKIVIIVLALFVIALVVIGGLTLYAKSYLTDERIRAYIIEAAEKSLSRKVELSTIRVSIFRGITVSNLEIKEKDSAASFVKAEEFQIRYQLLPLLLKSLVVDEIKLVNAHLNVQKNADNTFNFSDIIGTPGNKEPNKPAGAHSGLPVNLQIRSLSLKNTVIDYAETAGELSTARILINADLGVASPSASVVSSEGKFSITLVEARLKDKPRPVKDVSALGTYRINADLSGKKVEIQEIKADIAKVPITMRGYDSYADPVSFALELTVPETKLATVQQSAAPFLPQGIGLEGAVSLTIAAEKSSTTSNRLTFKGQMNMKNLAVAARGYRPVFSGTLRFTPELIHLDNIKLVSGSSSADITGRIRNYSEEPDIQVNVAAKALDLDAMMLPGRTSASGKTATSLPKKEEKEFELTEKMKLRAAGSVAIDSILVKGISIKNLRTAYEFRDNILRIPSMTGNTLNGSFRLQSAIDLSKRGTAYSLNADTNGIRLEEITAVFAPKSRDTLYGALFGKMDFSGSGTLKENIKRNLKGKGSFTVKDGTIKNVRVSSDLLAFLGLQNLREIPIDKADSSFTVADSVVNLTSLITSKDLIIDEKGTIGMDERLDLAVLVKASEKLSPRMLSQASISQFLSGEKGWTTIPLKIGGTVTKPAYSVDMQHVGKRAAEKLQQRAEEELFKAISGEKAGKGSARPKEKKKDKSPEDLIKGFLGR